MIKILLISKCEHCKHLLTDIYGNPSYCGNDLARMARLSTINEIPEWCPLETYQEKSDE